MSIEVLGVLQPTARIPHVCFHCSEQIEPGTRYYRISCADAGQAWTIKAHLECDDLYCAYGRDLGVDEYELIDWHDVKAWAAERAAKACPADTDGDGNCSLCARHPGIHG